MHVYDQAIPLGIHEWCIFQALFNLIAPALPDGLELSKFHVLVMFFLEETSQLV